jgi:hypothetical protein
MIRHARPARWSDNLGWFPGVAVVMAVGLLTMSLSLNAAREQASWAYAGFWLSLLVIVALPVARQLAPNVRRTERLLLLLATGLALYWVAVLGSPTQLTGYDDILNLRTLLDMLVSGRLFTENPLLLVNALYPAMGSTTAAFSQVSGVDPFTASIVVMGLLRVILLLGTFLLFETISGSAWVGALASVLYMTNPDFMFFSSAYVYESFALPLAIVALWLLAERQTADPATRKGLTLISLVCIACVVTGHHLTTIALAGALVLWTAAIAFRRWRGDDVDRVQGVGGMAAITIIAAVLWSLYVANEMIKYLGSLFLTTVEGALRFISGTGLGRALFESGGTANPPEDRVLALAMTATIVVALPIGLVILVRTLGKRPAALMLGLVALGYPATQVLRLTSSGGLEVASRANSYVFIGVAFALALLAIRVIETMLTTHRLAVRGAITSVVLVLFGGGVVLGSAWWSRLPGPFLVGADSRSISPQGDAVADWMLARLGPDQRVAADRANRLLLGSQGLQRVVFDARDPVGLLPLYADATLDDAATAVLQGQQIRYVLVDRRLSTALPIVGLYYDQEELRNPWKTPIAAAALGKFDQDGRVDRIYDSGDLQLYDTLAILDE